MLNVLRFLITCSGILMISSPIFAQEKFDEISVKASFISSFIAFTRWPLNLTTPKDTQIFLCVAGDDPYSEIFRQHKVKTRSDSSLVIKDLKNNWEETDFEQCHVLIIRLRDKKAINQLLQKVVDLPILTISEMAEYEDQETMINLATKKNAMAFSINRRRSTRVGIEFSSRMLRLAYKVIGDEE